MTDTKAMCRSVLILILGCLQAAASQITDVDRVAGVYYVVPRAEALEWSGTLSGLVVDRRGRGVPNAVVTVQDVPGSEILGRTATDDRGRFRIESLPEQADSVTVIGNGFVRWALDGQKAADNVAIPLDRIVDKAFFEALPTLEDPVERLWAVMELVGARQIQLEMDAVHAHIGSVRQELRLIASSLTSARIDDHSGGSPASRARRLLAWWADPADADLYSSGHFRR